MLAVKIILGLLGLGIVVFIHELGHFLAARLVGIEVEAFSLGWGKSILKKKIGAVEYRLSLFPLGGYCKMRGESDFREAYENNAQEIPAVKGTYYGAAPWKRIIVCFTGPFFNLLFAVLVLSVIWGAGFEVHTLDNRIVLASEVSGGGAYAADEAGLKTGDRIVKIGDRIIANYHDIQEAVTPNADRDLPVRVERDGQLIDLAVRPRLDKQTGAGRIGVYFWTDPLIDAVAAESPAAQAGLMPGDRILQVNGEDLPHSMALMKILQGQPASITVVFEREGRTHTAAIPMAYTDGEAADIGVSYKTIQYHTPSYSIPQALIKGLAETWKTFTLSLHSLTLLFRGIDLTKAVSGPVRITYMVGDAAAEGFHQGIGSGIGSLSGFLSLISIALCIMNLLPLPVLDGGMILLFCIEMILRRPLHPKAVYAFHTIGVVLIGGLMLLAIFGDILFLVHR